MHARQASEMETLILDFQHFLSFFSSFFLFETIYASFSLVTRIFIGVCSRSLKLAFFEFSRSQPQPRLTSIGNELDSDTLFIPST